MNTPMLLAVEGSTTTTAEIASQVPTWFAEWEDQLSRFRPTSDLCALNRSSAERVTVGETLFAVLKEALRAAELSEGLVTPTTLEALERAGYDKSFEQLQASAQGEAGPSSPAADYRKISLREEDHTVFRPSGLRLDLGGSAKGWSADQAAKRIAGRAHALIDAGGDIAVTGPKKDGTPWPIAVSSPFDPNSHLALLLIGEGGVATSGRTARRWMKDGKVQHHLIDPRTGCPATTDLVSVTVVGPSAMEAEVVSKAILIRGSKDGLTWLEAQERYAALAVREDGTQLRSSRMTPYLAS
jgi:thiamine biosynthesis lipoprotein